MATGPSYRVAFRRRREGKTDYQQRRGLILSGLPRIVIRGSLRNFTVQLIKADLGGDKVIVSAHSSELAKKYGWQGDSSNLPAAYLTGLLCGYKATTTGLKEVVLDIGLHSKSKGSRVFAALKGALDAGMMVSHDEGKLPDEKRILGKHVAEYAKRLSATPDIYQKRFAEQLSRGLRPEEIIEHFSEVKEKISSSFKKVEVQKFEEKKSQKEEGAQEKRLREAVTAEKTANNRAEKREEPKNPEEKA